MNGSTASGLEDAYMVAFWARQRRQWNLYAGDSYGTDLEPHEAAVRMAPDVLQLKRLRGASAVRWGAASYPALALA